MNLKIYLINPQCHGTSGTIVLAESAKRARELYWNKYDSDREFKLGCELLKNKIDGEYVCPDFVW